MDRNTALRYLQADPLLHMGMIEPIRCSSADILYAGERGVLLLEKRCVAHMLSVRSQAAGEALRNMAPDCTLWVAHQEFMVEPLRRTCPHAGVFACVQAVYLSKDSLPLDGSLDIRPLDASYTQRLSSLYAHPEMVDMRERLESGDLFGGFIGGELAAFGGYHLEGSIGMLEVLPAYRRRGLAVQLESFLVNRRLSQGRTPFAQIFAGNEPSVQLHRKLGFTIGELPLFWIDGNNF